LRAFLRSREQAEGLARSARAALSATKIEETRFDQLQAIVNTLYTLENARLQAQDNLAVAQGNVALNLINVYRALGGGWEIRYEKEEMAKGLEFPMLELAPSANKAEPLQAPKPEPPAKKSEDQQQKLEEKSP
jgi:hypothetical protein